MKTLNTIQTFSKIGKVVSKIIYICCIVGICGCVVGAAAILLGGKALKFGGVTLHSILQTEAGISLGTLWAAIAVGIILCIGELFVSRLSYRYFDNELKAGTPFTFDGAKELLHLGISVIWIPIVTSIAAQIVQDIIFNFMAGTEKISIDGFESVMLGIMFIFISLLCKYGAEEKHKEQQANCFSESETDFSLPDN